MAECLHPNVVTILPQYLDDKVYRKDGKEGHRVIFTPNGVGHDYGLSDWDEFSKFKARFVGKAYMDYRTGETARSVTVPCGKCVNCRRNKAYEWSLRLQFERELYPVADDCCFLTLTYDESHLKFTPDGLPDLDHRDVQKFLKNLRNYVRYRDGSKLRFFCSGEFGSSSHRPHYHLALFGYDFFKDGVFACKSGSGFCLYEHPLITKAWSDKDGRPIGIARFGEFSAASAQYTSNYVLKKLFSGFESYGRKEPYIQMSRRPGLGHDYIVRNAAVIEADGGVYFHGKFVPISRYMMKCLFDEGVSPLVDVNRKARAEKLNDIKYNQLEVLNRVDRYDYAESEARSFERKQREKMLVERGDV